MKTSVPACSQGRLQCAALPLKTHLRQGGQQLLSGCAAAVIVTGIVVGSCMLSDGNQTAAFPNQPHRNMFSAQKKGSVDFSNVSDGFTVSSPVAVSFAVEGMEVLPAAQGIIEGTGHFHLLIDADEEYPFGKPIPFDATHLHYGKGQQTANVELPAGTHKLALQFANAVHESYGPEYLRTINVTVE